jgi:membrane protease YdiL (CAAX protease family)
MNNSRTKPASELWLWLVIVGLVALVVYRTTYANPARADEMLIRNTMGKLRVQSAIGFQSLRLSTGQPVAAGRNDIGDRLMRSMEREAHTPEERLYVAITAAEVQGKKEALERLDALASSHPPREVEADIAALRTIYANGASSLDSAARERLIQRHDYLAHVALTLGAPPDVEPRKSIEQSARRTVLFLGVFGLALIAALMASCVLLILAIVLLVQGKIHRAYAPSLSTHRAFLEAFALYLALFLVGLGLARRELGLVNLNWEWLAWLIIPAIMAWTVRRGITRAEQRMAFGWYSGRGWLWEIASGIAGYVTGIPIIALGFVITLGLSRWSTSVPSHPIVHMLQGDGWHIVGLYALTCVFAPVLEETMFRGVLFHHLRSRWSWVISAPIVALIFAMMHPQGWVTIPVLGSIALVLAALREWRGSIIAPMVAHAANNFLALTLSLVLLR